MTDMRCEGCALGAVVEAERAACWPAVGSAHRVVCGSEDVHALAGLAINEKGQVEERHMVKVHHFSAAFIKRTSSAGSLH